MRRGDVWTVAGAKDYAGKARPVVIVQDDSFDGTESITICAFTTDDTDAPLFRLPVEPNERNGLRVPCRLMVDKVTTVPKSKLGAHIGRLDDEDVLRLEKKDPDETKAEKQMFDAIRAQDDLFAKQVTNNYNPCPYNFKYRYRTDDGIREGTCQDWEIEATYHKWSKDYGEQRALNDMNRVFGQEYPANGMLLAMGTHSLHQDT